MRRIAKSAAILISIIAIVASDATLVSAEDSGPNTPGLPILGQVLETVVEPVVEATRLGAAS